MKSKIQLIDRTYSKLRISGLTVSPSPNDISLALDELEGMLAEWELVNVCLNYNFEEQPKPNTNSGLVKGFENAVQCNLAVRLAPDFGKVPSDIIMQASQSYSVISSAVAKVKQTPYPNRQPIGEANTLHYNSWQRYYNIDASAPNDCNTQIMAVNDISDDNISYIDYLDSDEIEEVTLSPSAGLNILSQSNTIDSISFRVKAVKGGAQKIILEIKTKNGLQKTNCLWYSVIEHNTYT